MDDTTGIEQENGIMTRTVLRQLFRDCNDGQEPEPQFDLTKSKLLSLVIEAIKRAHTRGEKETSISVSCCRSDDVFYCPSGNEQWTVTGALRLAGFDTYWKNRGNESELFISWRIYKNTRGERVY
jgi:hypothetical protein